MRRREGTWESEALFQRFPYTYRTPEALRSPLALDPLRYMPQVYLDHAATTPLDPRVFEAMLPYLKEYFGNPSSVHSLGRKARVAVEESRERVAAHLGAEPGEIVFTSGGTESNNTALKGMLSGKRCHLITSASEHKAILQPAKSLTSAGYDVTILRPQLHGAIIPNQIEESLTGHTTLVSLMHTNNELGTITPIREIADVCHARGAFLHCDAVQAGGLFHLNVNELSVDMMSLSGHKFYGPKGIGILYLRGGVDFQPLVEGGAQERQRRSGTENVAAIVGLGKAFDLAMEELDDRICHITALRDQFYRHLCDVFGDTLVLNTPRDSGIRVAPHILNISFTPVGDQALDGEMLLLNLDLDGVLASAGSACTSGALEPSHVLMAIGRDRLTASSTIRFSLGKDNTKEEVDFAVEKVKLIVDRMCKEREALIR